MFEDKTIQEMLSDIASKEAISSGICAAAISSAMAAALGQKAAEITLRSGAFRYYEEKEDTSDEKSGQLETDEGETDKAAYDEEEYRAIFDNAKKQFEYLRDELMYQTEADRENYETLVKALAISDEDSSKVNVLENARRVACASPLDVMRLSCKVITFLDIIRHRSDIETISDINAAFLLCRSAIKIVSLKILSQTALMVDKKYSASFEKEVKDMLERYEKLAKI